MMAHARSPFTSLTLCLSLALGAAALSGCRVNEEDVHRWERTELGPTKLAAVVTHDKYPAKLRIEAAMSLIRMKPRAGKRIGIEKLFDSLRDLQPEERKKLVGGLVPLLVAEMGKPPQAPQGMATDEQKATDPSIPFKDAAFGLLIYDKAALVTEEEHKKTLRDALLAWIQADFSRRVAISSQLFGVEQIVRNFKEEGAKILPPLINEDAAYDRISRLVADLGTPETKALASQRLVDLAKLTESQAWFDKKKPQIKEANEKSGYKSATEKQLNEQTAIFQEEQAIKIYGSLNKVKGRPAVNYLLAAAADPKRRPKVRQAALAALEGGLDRTSAEDAAAIVRIAAAEDTPDDARDLAFARVGELPRDVVAPKLYELFPQKDDKKWKIRWVAAATLLKMSTPKDLPDFYANLSKHVPNPAAGFAMGEPLEYGRLLGMMKPPVTREQMAGELKNPALAVKLTAIGYFFQYGKAGDVAALAPVADEKTALPKVSAEDATAKWQCAVPKQGGKPGESEMKETTTVGEFVKTCVEPRMQANK